MNYRKFLTNQVRLMNAEGEGSNGGGSTGEFNDTSVPNVQDKLKLMVDEAVTGLKNKNSELLGALKETKDKYKQFEGLDIERLKALQQQLDGNEEMRLLAEGKVEDVVNRRLENYKKDYENQLSARDSKLTEYEKILKQKEDKLASLVIDGQIREAYSSLGFEPSAMDDVLRLGRDVFIMNEQGTAVPRDNSGNIIFGKDAKSPITASEWLINLAEKKQYLRGASRGAGIVANRGSNKPDTSKMTSTQRIAEGLRQLGMQ